MKLALLLLGLGTWWGWLVLAPPPPAPSPPEPARVAPRPTSPAPSTARPAGALSHRVVRYTITARLDPNKHVVTGDLSLDWHNPSTREATGLPFHLYLNAFKHPGTLWLSEAWKDGQRVRLKAGGWGGIDVADVKVDGVAARTALEVDGTVLRVTPARPVAGRATATITLRFTATLPKVRARTGYAKDFHLVGQWFPKIGVRDADGTWHCHPFYMLTEFYADFGTYDVTLEAPTDYDVAASGVRVSTSKAPRGARRYHYRADDVHDFVWMAAKGAKRMRRTLGQTRLEIVYFRDDPARVRRHLDHMAWALERLQRWYAPYPYPVLTCILVPPGDASEAGGMEYPTLFTSSSGAPPFLERVGPLNTTVHELTHQYFYGLLASNEYQEPWLDEGFTNYVTGQIVDDLYGRDRSAGELGPLHLGYFSLLRMWVRMQPSLDPPRQRASAFATALSYFTNVYGKTSLVLRTLEDQIGTKRMRALLRDYVRSFRFKHPTGQDFFRVLDRHVKDPLLRRFVREAVQTPGTLDYRVVRLRSLRLEKWDGRFTNAVDQRLRRAHEALRREHRYLNRVLVERRGTLRLPVTVELRFADGTRLRRRWDGQARWHWFEIPHRSRLSAAVVDPDRTLALEHSLLDTGLRRTPDARPARRLAGRILSVLQITLQIVGF